MSIKETVIDKLNNTNYSIWKFKLEMLLIREDLYNVVVNDPPEAIDEAFRQKDRKARAIINLLISDDQIIHVKNIQTAKDTWDALRNIHERANLSSKLFLLRKLYSSKLSEGGNVNDHINKIFEIRDKLSAIGEDINDQHISALMLCSLPASYDTLITALEARPEHELTPDYIRSKLIDEYSKRIESSNAQNEVAYKAKNKYDKSKFNYRKYCEYCKKSSHNKNECWHLKNKNKTNTGQNAGYYKNKQKYKQPVAFQANKNNKNQESKESNDIDYIDSNLKNVTFLTNNENMKNSWVIDSGSSSHICNNLRLFDKLTNENKTTVMIANGNVLQSYGCGNVNLRTITSEGIEGNITLKEVLFVPEIESNLISVKKATENGCMVIFENDSCKINYQGNTCLEGYINNNLYEANLKNKSTETALIVNTCTNNNCIKVWHRRLGHKNNKQIMELISKDMATGIKIDKCTHNEECENCIISKLSDFSYPKQAQFRAVQPLELVHSDLCGPMQTPTMGGKYYFLTFVDDYSRFTYIYLIKNKDEVFSKFREYLAMTANKFQRKVQNIRSDQGGEYIGKEFEEYLLQQGIMHQLSVAYCSQQNGVAERKNRTLMEMTRCLLNEANLPNKFWGEAINTANYLQNRLPTTACDTTPYEKWNGHKPDLSNIKIFGSKAYAYVQKQHRGKLDRKAIEGILMGFDNRSKGYRVYIKDKGVIVCRTVKILENKNPNTSNTESQIHTENTPQHSENTSKKNISQLQLNLLGEEFDKTDIECENTGNNTQSQISSGQVINDQVQPRRSERVNKGVPPDRLIYLTNESRIIEPKNWTEINEMKNPLDKQNWLNATKEEINSLKENNTWELVDPPPGKRVIGCKWAFKAKYNNSGKIEKYKARLVAKGFSQKFGVDYEETFAPVVSHTTIRSFLTMALYKNLHLRHIDIKTAFLHGDLEEEVYMSQPEGYVKEGEEQKVCKLNKAIYGLKQSARAWNIKIGETLTKLGFKQGISDKCLFKYSDNVNTIYIIVYVDDLIIASNENNVNKIINALSKEYKITDLGELSYYLNINIERPENGIITMDQKNKIDELVTKYGLNDAKPCETPMDAGFLKFNDDSELLPDNNLYRQAIGSLLYISNITRPDISAAINILSRKVEKPTMSDWNALKRVIKYLKHTRNFKFIINNKTAPVLTAFSDADWANDSKDRKSMTGNIFKLGNNLITWIAKKQSTVSVSSAEAEYISAASACKELLWILNLFNELDLAQSLPIQLFEDNTSCIKMSESDKLHSRTKHIDVRHHLIKDLVKQKTIELCYVPSKDMIADVLTKPLPKPDFLKHRHNLQLQDFKLC